jgi:hypothetical protein
VNHIRLIRRMAGIQAGLAPAALAFSAPPAAAFAYRALLRIPGRGPQACPIVSETCGPWAPGR